MLTSAGINFRQPTVADVEYLAENMRQQDVDEVWAASHFSPIEAIQTGVDESDYAVVALNGDVPVMIYGLKKLGLVSDNGIPWALGAYGVYQCRKELVTMSRSIVDKMLDICPVLFNYVDCRNTVSIHWLKWLGFTMHSAKPYGAESLPFHKFTMVKEDV